jgi:hypothetical protein
MASVRTSEVRHVLFLKVPLCNGLGRDIDEGFLPLLRNQFLENISI